MQKTLSYISDNRQQIFGWLKWFTLPLVLLALYYQLFIKTDFSHAVELFQKGFTQESLPYFLAVLALMPVNLCSEALKWQVALRNTHQISFAKSFQSVFAGISLSIFTPKRVGEYAGRLLLIKNNRTSAAGSLFVSNFAQMISNLIFGLLGLLIFYNSYKVKYEGLEWAVPLAAIGSIVLLAAYFNLDKVLTFFRRFALIDKVSDKIQVISTYQNQTLFTFLMLSLLKYIVFVLQFVLLLFAFGISMNWLWGMIAAACVFFVKTLLPVPASVELAARGSIAIYFFSFFTENHIGILVASIVLWGINLALPAIIGSYYISKSRI